VRSSGVATGRSGDGTARTGLGAGRAGYVHESVLYGSDAELLDCVLPFLTGGLAAGEPTFVAFGPEHTALIRLALPDRRLRYLDGDDRYTRPASAIAAYRTMLGELTNPAGPAGGARQVRIVGELPPAVMAGAWPWWARYEAAVNLAYDAFPLWSVCTYDRHATPATVLADVARTHPLRMLPGDRHEPNTAYQQPAEFIAGYGAGEPDPLEAAAPLIDLTDPAPVEARHAIQDADRRGVLPTVTELSTVVIAVHEAVTNAFRHGKPPVRLRLWAAPDRVLAAITDLGDGPADPFAGLWPDPDRTDGGMGLWIIHELCDHVSVDTTSSCTVRLTFGRPRHGARPAVP
jgi:anti-sigma regulatory factor (Ser/Thr protein kinase)